MDVDRCDLGKSENCFREDLTVGDDDEVVGSREWGVGSGEWLCIDIVRLPDGNVQSFGGNFYWRWCNRSFPTDGLIGLGDHEINRKGGILRECFERGNGEGGSAGEEDVEWWFEHSMALYTGREFAEVAKFAKVAER